MFCISSTHIETKSPYTTECVQTVSYILASI